MTYPFGETVQVLNGTGTVKDRYGKTVPGWAVKATYTNVPVAPTDANANLGNERTDQRETVYIGLTIYVPDGADIVATDRVVVRGRTWEVVGDPEEFQSPYTGWRPGRAVALTRVTG